MKKSLLIELTCGLLILLFVFTALSKIAGFNSFKATLAVSPVIGDKNGLIAWAIPAAELGVTVLLFIPRFRLPGMFCSLLLILLFTFYLLYILVFHADHLPCTCGGIISRMTWKQHIVFNCIFIMLIMAAIIAELHSKLLLQQAGSKPKTWTKE